MPEEKVWMASYNLEDVAQLWFVQLQEDEGTPPWGRFKELLNLRFGPALRSAPLFELTECRRTGTVEEYSNRFQALLPRTGRLLEDQRVQLYTGGLLPPLSHQVRIHAPETLAAAMSLARALELVELDRLNSAPGKAVPRALGPPPAPRPGVLAALPAPVPQAPAVQALPAPQAPPLALPAPPPPRGGGKRLSTEEQAERRRLGLCYNCNEPYTRGHNPSAAASSTSTASSWLRTSPLRRHPSTLSTPSPAFQCAAPYNSSTGSTHCFIGEAAAQRAGLPVTPRPRLTATVANGERIACPGVLRQAAIVIDSRPFEVDLYIMPLAGYDLVLGTQWLATLGDIAWNVAAGTMEFTVADQQVCWRSVAPPTPPRLHSASVTEPLLDELLASFADVFAEPKGLPPARGRAHRIILKPAPRRWRAALRISGRPQDGAGCKKPDGSWRFRVDYRALNAVTVKDAFPIPVVDELLDELHGAKYFTKLDLRSGYHQVRMRPEDVHKTAFRTHDGLYEFLVMPFGLCNAPATFQALMNDVLRPFLRRFVLVFFDDILIYSKSWADHLRHLRAVLSELRRHTLFVKRSKCAFGVVSVAYLGHTISEAGVAMDSAKVQAIHDWPELRSARAVRGFLGLAGYYRKFIHNYGSIAAPFAALLKKEGFAWGPEAASAFLALKKAVTSAPVLAMPNFDKPFIVECDASSQVAVAPRHRGPRQPTSVSSLAWSGRCATGGHTRGAVSPPALGHHSAKTTGLASRGLQLLRRVQAGATNAVADAASGRDTVEGDSLPSLAPRFDFIDKLRQAQLDHPALVALRGEITAGTRLAPWAMVDGRCNFARTSRPTPRCSKRSWGPYMRTDTKAYSGRSTGCAERVRTCKVCQRYKSEHQHPAGLLLPLPVPQGVWTDVALDFVEALPRVRGKSVILTVVDRFSKYCHFIPLAHPYSAESVAQAFFNDIVRLHGVPQSMVSDRDTVFTSTFWQELMRLMGTNLQMTTAFHPQSDGQSESANRVILMYLRCLAGDRPREWLRWLPWAEFLFNTAYQTSLRDTPFRVVYGRDPPSIRSYEPGETRVPSVAKRMEERAEFLADVRYRLEQAQAYQKRHYDRAHRDITYQVGDWALLRLRQRAASSLPQAVGGKLKPRFFGPYRVVELINEVAVRLELPPRARIHNVFHVGTRGRHQQSLHHCRSRIMAPLARNQRAVRYRRLAASIVCSSWKGTSAASATREDVAPFRTGFPQFQLEDELALDGEGDVMFKQVYTRRHRARDVRRAKEHAAARMASTQGTASSSG
ncbi:hypothetical protein U9M48_034121 [Paspalum notatum var. saurae]|uniref:Uncharacterized protein n=1 Tax=Paspalum notatum var. saurae TaxID=547442 RepID=A0AAQ3X788_PASNO